MVHGLIKNPEKVSGEYQKGERLSKYQRATQISLAIVERRLPRPAAKSSCSKFPSISTSKVH
jgi:hypothetical protein